MFNKFFGNKPGGKATKGGQEAEAEGGGFFNLPAPTQNPDGSPAPESENGVPAVSPQATDNASGSTMFSGIEIKQTQQAASDGGGGLFGDLSVKAPAQTDSPPQTNAKSDAGGSMFGDLQIKPSDQSEPAGGSMFNGMAVKETAPESPSGGMFNGMAVKETAPDAAPDMFGALSVKPAPITSPASGMGMSQQRRKQDSVRETPKSSPGSGVAALDALAGNATQMRPQAGNRKKKKKKSGFRPGFGREMSVAESAALQRGAVPDSEIHQAEFDTPQENEQTREINISSTSSPSIAEYPAADRPVDVLQYAHEVLPPAQVHDQESEEEAQSPRYSGSAPESAKAAPTEHSGGTSMLAGLTIHAQAPAVPENETAVAHEPESVGGGLLSGLSLRSNSGQGRMTGAHTAVSRPDPSARTEMETAPANTEQRLHQNLAQFKDSAMRFRQQLHEISQGAARVAENKIILSKELIQHKTELQKAEIAQEAASEREDFQQADSLNSVIAGATHKIKSNQASLKKQTEEASHLETEKSLLSQQQLTATTRLMDELGTFAESKTVEMTKVSKHSKKMHEQEEQRLATEEERIQLQVRHIELDNKHLEDEQQQTDAAISDQSKEISERRTEVEVLKQEVDAAVIELRALLAEKEEEQATYQEQLDEADAHLDNVRRKFERQLNRLNARRVAIKTAEAEIEAEQQILAQDREVLDAEHSKSAADEAEFKTSIETVQQSLRVGDYLQQALKKREEELKSAQSEILTDQSILSKFEEDTAKAEQNYRLSLDSQEDLQKKAGGMRAELSSITEKLPALEQSKKNAVAGRNFKEADRLKKEMTSLQSSKEEFEQQLGGLESEFENSKAAVDECAKVQTEMEGALAERRQQIEQKNFGSLRLVAHHLRLQISKIDSIQTSTNHSELDVTGVAILLLQAELDVCVADGDAIKNKYGLEEIKFEEQAPEPESGSESVDDQPADQPIEPTDAADIDELLQEQSKMEIELSNTRAEVVTLETRIEAAIEEEDYEEAEQLSAEQEVLKEAANSTEASLKRLAEQIEKAKEEAAAREDAETEQATQQLDSTAMGIAAHDDQEEEGGGEEEDQEEDQEEGGGGGEEEPLENTAHEAKDQIEAEAEKATYDETQDPIEEKQIEGGALPIHSENDAVDVEPQEQRAGGQDADGVSAAPAANADAEADVSVAVASAGVAVSVSDADIVSTEVSGAESHASGEDATLDHVMEQAGEQAEEGGGEEGGEISSEGGSMFGDLTAKAPEPEPLVEEATHDEGGGEEGGEISSEGGSMFGDLSVKS
jgi:hypothetical protein